VPNSDLTNGSEVGVWVALIPSLLVAKKHWIDLIHGRRLGSFELTYTKAQQVAREPAQSIQQCLVTFALCSWMWKLRLQSRFHGIAVDRDVEGLVRTPTTWIEGGSMTCKRVLIAAIVLSTFFNSAPLAETGPAFKFVSAEVTLSPRSVVGDPTAHLLLEGTQLPLSDIEPSDFADGAASSSQVRFTSTGTDPGKSTRHWLIVVTYKSDERPAGGIKYITFKYNGITFALSYKLLEDKTPTLDWTVTPLLPDAALTPGDRFPIWIVTKDVAATNIRLACHSIHSDPGQTLLAGPWSLCDGPKDDAKCVELTSNATPSPFAVAANDAKNFWIKPPDGSLVGKYTGSFWISADQSKSGTSLAMTFYESNACRSIVGLIILIGSVVAAWFFGVYLRGRANKLQLERPFAVLRSQQHALIDQYEALDGRISAEAGTFETELQKLGENLKTSSLSDVLGTGLPSAFGATPQLSNGYKERLELLSNKTALLKKLVPSRGW
jgi:hypothetical protein